MERNMKKKRVRNPNLRPGSSLTKNEWHKMESMIYKGVPDTEIANYFNLSFYWVQKTSARYWNEKMKEKDE